ncbi:alpha/beta hydrolase [Candidatus Woesearchaeota archaeon]|nr:alpha/beta hydrolase [Candidatus Woesearchaeota archaeon]
MLIAGCSRGIKENLFVTKEIAEIRLSIADLQQKVKDNPESADLKLFLAQEFFSYDKAVAEAKNVSAENQPFLLLDANNTNCAVLIHGFGASPHEVLELGQFLFSRHINAYGIRLAGHGTSNEEFSESAKEDWYGSIRIAMKSLPLVCKKISLVGVSYGAIIALKEAALSQIGSDGQFKDDSRSKSNGQVGRNGQIEKDSQFESNSQIESNGRIGSNGRIESNGRIDSIITISAPIFFQDSRISKAKYYRYLFPRTMRNLTDAELPYYSHEFPTGAVAQMAASVEEVKGLLQTITIPALILQSLQDARVKPQSADFIYAKLSSQDKTIIRYEEGSHVLLDSPVKEKVFADILEFIDRNSREKSLNE